MIGQPGVWQDVKQWTYLLDKNGEAWRVRDVRGAQLLLQNASGESRRMLRPPLDQPVTLLVPSEEDALAAVKNQLGGEVIAEKTPERGWTCPPLVHRLDVIHTHMFTMHGIWTRSGPGSKSVERLIEAHRDDHLAEDGPTSHAFIPHEHHALKEISK